MTYYKVIFLLLILPIYSCKTGKKILSKWDNGQVKVERIYSDTSGVYIEKEYYENGKLGSKTRFENSSKNGESVSYYSDGKLLGRCTYRNGKINGEVTEFHKTGSVMFKGNQADGEFFGLAIHYYDNGKPEIEYYYTGNKAFIVSSWDSNGIQQVKNGEGIRKFKGFLGRDRNDNDTTIDVFVIETYKDSLRNGLCKYYNLLENKLILERDFQDGRIILEKWK